MTVPPPTVVDDDAMAGCEGDEVHAASNSVAAVIDLTQVVGVIARPRASILHVPPFEYA